MKKYYNFNILLILISLLICLLVLFNIYRIFNLRQKLIEKNNNMFFGIDRYLGPLFISDNIGGYLDIVSSNTTTNRVISYKNIEYKVKWINPSNGPKSDIRNIKILQVTNSTVFLENDILFTNPKKLNSLIPETYCSNLKPNLNLALNSNNFEELKGKKIMLLDENNNYEESKNIVQIINFENVTNCKGNVIENIFNINSICNKKTNYTKPSWSIFKEKMIDDGIKIKSDNDNILMFKDSTKYKNLLKYTSSINDVKCKNNEICNLEPVFLYDKC